NWTAAGTLTPNASTVVFNGVAQQLTVGATAPFNILTINTGSTLTVQAASSTLVANALTTIQAGGQIVLNSIGTAANFAGGLTGPGILTASNTAATNIDCGGDWNMTGGTFNANQSV